MLNSSRDQGKEENEFGKEQSEFGEFCSEYCCTRCCICEKCDCSFMLSSTVLKLLGAVVSDNALNAVLSLIVVVGFVALGIVLCCSFGCCFYAECIYYFL